MNTTVLIIAGAFLFAWGSAATALALVLGRMIRQADNQIPVSRMQPETQRRLELVR